MSSSSLFAVTQRYRLMFNTDPATAITIAWEQLSGTGQTLYYDIVDHGTNWASYANFIAPYRSTQYLNMSNQFVKLTGLTPNTKYFFVIKDSEGTSQRFWFKTCPNVSTEPLSFISGGDSRSGQTQRINANITASKIRPHAVLFGGDLVDVPDVASYQTWLDDLQFMITSDNQIIPIVHSFGNHEAGGSGGPNILNDLFDVTPDAYYNIRFGGNLFSVYTLNGELLPGHTIVSATKRTEQTNWLATQLPTDTSIWKAAQYHRPIAPHNSSKTDGQDEFNDWAQVFYDNKVRLVMESDAHVVKLSKEVKPSSPTALLPINNAWFSTTGIEADKGITFIGEGSWGTLRPNDHDQDITDVSGSFYQFNWIIVTKCEILVRTVDTQNPTTLPEHIEGDYFSISPQLDSLLWKPAQKPTGVLRISKCNVPLASFAVASDSICQNEIVSFSDQSSNTPTTWMWNFGDGTTATTQNPMHSYTATGTYTITMTASNAAGSDTRSIQKFVTVKSLPTILASNDQAICLGENAEISVSGADSYAWSHGLGGDSVQTVSPTTNTQYIVTGTTNGCLASDTVLVSIKPNPTITASGATTICAGVSTEITAIGADNYEWNNGLPNEATNMVSPLQTTRYIVTGYVDGCFGQDSILINVNPLPIVSLANFNPDTLCLSQTPVGLPVGEPQGGQYSGPGLTGNTFSPTLAGNGLHLITYSYTDINNCENTAQRGVFVSSCLEIMENELSIFSIYPNPTSNMVLIERENPSNYSQLEIFNAEGKSIQRRNLIDNPTSIDVSQWPKGNYFFHFTNNTDHSIVKKIVVE